MAEPVPQNNPGDPQPTDPVDFVAAQRQKAAMLAMNGLDGDADEASRAYDLSRSTNVNPALIHTDTEAFGNKVKTSIANHLVLNDDFLAEYARSHVLAPTISNDDWGQLSKISSLINPWRGQIDPISAQQRARQQEFNPDNELGLSLTKPLAAGAQAVRQTYDESQIVQWSPTRVPASGDFAGRLGWSLGTGFDRIGDISQDLARYLMVGGTQLFTGTAAIAGEVGKELGISDAPKAAQDVSSALQDPGLYESLIGIPIVGGVAGTVGATLRALHERLIGPVTDEHAAVLNKTAEEMATSVNIAKPYVEAGRMPPVGVDKHIDGYFAELAKNDADWLKEVDKEIGASSTYARNPEFFANEFFNLRHPPDMSVSFEGVKKLYGEEGKPEPGDNKLGNVWKGAEQYDHAKDFGGDIDISAVDWAKLKPEVRDELRDFVRLRRGGMTVEEAKAQQVEEVEEEPVITLEKGVWKGTNQGPNDHVFNINDSRSGDIAGNIQLTERDNGKELHVDYMGGEAGPGSLGIAGVKGVRDALAKQFPKAERITAYRDTGARETAGQTQTYTTIPIKREGPVDTVARAAKINPLAPEVLGSGYIIAPSEGFYTGAPIKIGDVETKSVSSFPLRDSINSLPSGERLGWLGDAPAKILGDKFIDAVGDTPVHVVSDTDMAKLSKASGWDFTAAGFYDSKADHIVISDKVASGRAGQNEAIRTILHEASHKFMQSTIEKYPKLQDLIEKIMYGAQDALAAQNHPHLDYFKGLRYFDDIHEFIAGAHSDPHFWDALHDTKIPEDLHNALALGHETKTFWDAFRNIFKQLWKSAFPDRPLNDSYLDAVLRVTDISERLRGGEEKGPTGGLQATEEKPTTRAIQGELPGMTRMEDRPLFKTPGTIGMNAKRMENYNKLIEKENQEKIELSRKLAERSEREQQTSEWKENYDKVKDEVRSELHQRPDVAAERFMRDGITPEGNKQRKIKLDAKALTAEQKKALPEEFVGETGANPDDLAPVFGFQSGDELVASLARGKAQQDLEGLTPTASFNQRLKSETERVMRQRYGDLETNVLEMAKDQVFSPTTLDRLSEEVLALAEHGGQELTIDKGTLQKLARDKFNSVPIGSHSSDKYIAAAGRAGQAAEDALLEGNASEAFKAKQQQYLAMFYGSEARKLEKVKDQFDKRVPKWQRREPPGIEQSDAVWIHQILEQIGLGKRSLQDLDRSKQLTSPYKTMREYAEGVNGAHDLYNTDVNAMPVGQKVAISDFLFTDNYRNTVEKMLPDEFRQVFDSLKSIDHFSRNEKKYTVKGNKEDLENVVNGLVERLKAAVDNKPITDKVQQTKSAGRLTGTWLLNPESWMRRLDLGDTFGPFNQLVIRPITEGQYTLRTLERDFASRWKEVGSGFTDLRKKISNPLFKESDGSPIQMTKANAYAVLQNMGNVAQRAKLIKGWNIDPDTAIGEQKIWNWLRQVGIGPEDLARAQKLGDVFGDAFKHSEHAYTSINGVAPARIDLGKMQTPWGEVDEWYHPLIPDPLRHKVNLSVDEMMGESGYYRPSPAAGYTKTRTGAVYPIDLTFDSVPFKLKQILNDAAMRPSVTEVSKIVYNKQFQAAFKRYYGAEYMSALDGWMKDVAGNRSWVPQNMAALNKAVTGLVQNLNTALIGFNLGTVAKHAPTAAAFSIAEVGPINFARSMAKMIYELPGSREAWNWVMENSEEVANRMRHVEDTLIGQNQEMFKKLGWTGKIANIRDLASWYGHYPVGITDLISAVAMFHAEYRRLGEEHPEMSHGDLLYGANTAVRRTHGSSILSNRPSLMRAGGLWKLVSPFYNFFNNALNRTYEIGWQSKLAVQGREVPEMVGFDSKEFKAGIEHVPRIVGGLIVFGVIPSLIEQMVDPIPETQGENKALYWAKVLTQAYPSMAPGVRDIVNGLNRNRDPSLGLFGTAMRDVAEPLRTKSWTQSPGQAFQTANRAIGMLTGLTMEPVGRAGRFMLNVMHGDEHPQGLSDWARGLYKGTMKEQRR